MAKFPWRGEFAGKFLQFSELEPLARNPQLLEFAALYFSLFPFGNPAASIAAPNHTN
jgi:hypothetical protein